MSKPTPADFFNKEAAERYDERNSKLTRISDCLHFLTGMALKSLPAKAHVLCVGVGTGAEIFSLAEANTEWTFLALDPSLDMLNVCKERIKKAGLENRCEFVHGYIQDLPKTKEFDAALSILVAHFIKKEERISFFQNMTKHLKAGGYLVNAEISFDLSSESFPQMLKGWEQVQSMMGATPESLANLPTVLKEILTVLPPEVTEEHLKLSGIKIPTKFFQAMMINAWCGQKHS